MNEYFIIAAALGVTLDLVFGDPIRMPHIVRFIGWLTVKCEELIVSKLGRSIFSGLLLWLLLNVGLLTTYHLLASLLSAFSPWPKVLLDALLIFQCLAFKDLVKHVRLVRIALGQNIEKARKRVSYIVGRDTKQMDESDVCRAAIESGSENLNDAVIAPLFWLFILGPAGIFLFRISNTLDAMVGHRNERYELLGKVSARVDDVLNFIPARLCALFILPMKKLSLYTSLKPDAIKHPSPNAGWPEASMAHRLGVVIGGRMYENGELVQTAQMNEGRRQPNPMDIERSTKVMGIAYAKAITLFTAVYWITIEIL
ncbi:MAG: adenosylcobinamide-phosphate synthase CbiB [Verrucomicrobiota bacterium]